MVLAAASSLVAAESVLALTPIAIKKTPLDPLSAIWSRVLSSGVLGYALSGDRTLAADEWFGAGALGYTNLLHVASSYEAFRNLPAGQAMSLFYTYPLWNLVFGAFFEGERITASQYGLMGLAAVGSTLLNQDPGVAASSEHSEGLGRKPVKWWGVLMALVAALTESGMHALLKHFGWMDAAKSVWVVNISAALWLSGITGINALFGSGKSLEFKGDALDVAELTGFHSFAMFAGYWLRFYAVPRLSTVTYSILSYAGLLASYVFGLWFLGEKPGWMSMLGAILILVSGLVLQNLPDEKDTRGEKEMKKAHNHDD